MARYTRKRIVVDPQTQALLAVRVVLYGTACLFMLLVPVTFLRVWNAPDRQIFAHFLDACRDYSTVILAAVAIAPLVILDMLKFSLRIVGPIHRLHREMRSLADDGTATFVSLRANDCWHDLAEDFNRLPGVKGQASQQTEVAGSAELSTHPVPADCCQ